MVGRVSSKCCLQAKVSENAMALDVVILSNFDHISDSHSGKKSMSHNLESQKSLTLFWFLFPEILPFIFVYLLFIVNLVDLAVFLIN